MRINLPGVDHPADGADSEHLNTTREDKPAEVACRDCGMAASQESKLNVQDIVIGLEDEEGEKMPVEMDEPDDQIAAAQEQPRKFNHGLCTRKVL